MGDNQRTPRTCLKCLKLFPSTSPGNRICPRCAVRNSRVDVMPRESAVTPVRGTR